MSYAQTETNINAAQEKPAIELTVKTGSDGNIVTGVITDQSGALVNFAIVTVCAEDGTVCYTSPTNTEGVYEFRNIPEGKYKLKINADGFDGRESGEFAISIDSYSKQDFQLAVTAVKACVEVNGAKDDNSAGIVGLIDVGTVTTTTHIQNNKLISAVQMENADEVKRLIGAGKKVNVKNLNYDGNFPLHYAVEQGNLEIVDLLLNAGARISVKNYEKRTPLMMIDEDATVQLVNRLLGFGAAINAADKEKNTALMLAAGDASEEVVRVLIQNGANVNLQNKKGRTALMQAAEQGNLENVRALLEAGADISLKDKSGETAWNKTSAEDVKQILVTYGAIAERP